MAYPEMLQGMKGKELRDLSLREIERPPLVYEVSANFCA
jgi:hypothetical protein